MKHSLLMIGACVVPLLLFFLLPLFGVSGNITLFAFIVLMFGGHLLMMRGHAHHAHTHTDEQNIKEAHNDKRNN